MKKLVILGVLVTLLAFVQSSYGAFTSTYSGVTGLESIPSDPGFQLKGYMPNPRDVYDLDHWWYYTWGIDLGFRSDQSGYEIQAAELRFKNIRNYNDTANILYIHMIDNSPVGVTQNNDLAIEMNNNLLGQGILLAEYSDGPPSSDGSDLIITLEGDALNLLNTYAEDGIVGFGFDPDCHFYNDGVSLALQVPTPGALLLGSIGMGVVGWLRKRKSL